MKIILNIISQEDIDQDEDTRLLGHPTEYDDLPTYSMTFYNIDAIAPSIKGYTLVYMGGYEYIAKIPHGKLEKEIDKQKRIIISEN